MTLPSNLQNITLPVVGMDCGGCVRSVDKALRALPGVGEVNVSLDTAQAVAQIDPARVTRQALVTAIEDAGFDVPAAQS
ncbi:heavy metal transporter [Hylemonella gracilis str. Niagara R]|uniref:Heavy metal transporter n=1 Tax=Hylemonella gracilis str. Niagara R TaxID=1458275 RepID=A0A016XFV4_9BURK|nr:heavy metal-associated domain-containing protein [Hylemonella gracilis]EYC50053.1 heavy metal transporter [Hylemonella gracilis str. Niagara R]